MRMPSRSSAHLERDGVGLADLEAARRLLAHDRARPARRDTAASRRSVTRKPLPAQRVGGARRRRCRSRPASRRSAASSPRLTQQRHARRAAWRPADPARRRCRRGSPASGSRTPSRFEAVLLEADARGALGLRRPAAGTRGRARPGADPDAHACAACRAGDAGRRILLHDAPAGTFASGRRSRRRAAQARGRRATCVASVTVLPTRPGT